MVKRLYSSRGGVWLNTGWVARVGTAGSFGVGPYFSRYCAGCAADAKFGGNVRFRLQAIWNHPRPSADGVACPAAAPLGATYPALTVGAYKTGKIQKLRH